MPTVLFMLYEIAPDGRIVWELGGGSSTPAKVRMYPTCVKAASMRDRYFPKAKIKRVEF